MSFTIGFGCLLRTILSYIICIAICRSGRMIKAKQGDKVIIPPGYGHLTINASNKVLKMANWVARDFESIYSPIKEKGGGAYFILEDNIVRNQAYENVPELRVS